MKNQIFFLKNIILISLLQPMPIYQSLMILYILFSLAFVDVCLFHQLIYVPWNEQSNKQHLPTFEP